MQPLAPAGSGYTAAQVRTALHAASRTWSFRYEVVDAGGAVLGSLATVEEGSGSVSQDTAARVRRTLRLAMTEDTGFDPLSMRLRPWARLAMPDGYVEWPQGTFLVTTPPRQMAGNRVRRSLQGYDLGQFLWDDKLEDRLTVEAGTAVTSAISAQLTAAGLTAQNVAPSAATLPVARDWALGVARAQVIDDLLAAINYAPLWFDPLGVAQVLPYVELSQRPIGYRYANDRQSVLLPGIQQGLDLWAVPNVFVAVVSRADRTTLRSVYTNANPLSPTSTVRRGRRITSVTTEHDAVDQATLDAACQRHAVEASQVYETVTLDTGLMPFHGDDDVIEVSHSGLSLAATYRETAWTLALAAGGRMSHQLRKTVTV